MSIIYILYLFLENLQIIPMDRHFTTSYNRNYN